MYLFIISHTQSTARVYTLISHQWTSYGCFMSNGRLFAGQCTWCQSAALEYHPCRVLTHPGVGVVKPLTHGQHWSAAVQAQSADAHTVVCGFL